MRQSWKLALIALTVAGCARAAAFSANVAIIAIHNQFTVSGQFAGSAGIDPLTQPVTLRVGAFSITIPAGSFKRDPIGHYVFGGNINGAQLAGSIWSQDGNRYLFGFTGRNAEGLPTVNPVEVQLAIGSYSGDASVTVRFYR
jgi:hypothetical protein